MIFRSVLSRIRNRHYLAVDAMLAVAAPIAAYALRFEGLSYGADAFRDSLVVALCIAPFHLTILYFFGVYRCVWPHASAVELERLFAAALTSAFSSIAIGIIALPALGILAQRVPLSVLAMTIFFTAFGAAFPRLVIRISVAKLYRLHRGHGRRVIIAGAGTAGKLIMRELVANPRLSLEPIGFIDDDARLHGQLLAGLPVLGPISRAGELAIKHDAGEIIIAMPSASGSVVRRLVEAAQRVNIETRIMSELSELLSHPSGRVRLRHVEIQDLLRRDPVSINVSQVHLLVTGTTVLITGAGGSIGGELCRQVASLDAKRIVLVGHGENSIFDIFNELRLAFPYLEVVPVVADVRDEARMSDVFLQYRPTVVFHAAAHKHVPLMEENPVEAVTNNVIGTRNVVNAALVSGVERFVLISTDKAVRPTSVMGASKRVAEQIVQRAAIDHQRNFVSVRFGNVLGSRGSVVPTFMRQIRAGGPVTITHPEMRRFFMTIPEAVQLVMQSGALGRGGEVFVLDMGEPVKIADLAEDLIRLCGLEVGHDVAIEYTGIRPGEKLYEETFFDEENATPTVSPKILYSRHATPLPRFTEGLSALLDGANSGGDAATLRGLFRDLVPDFCHESFGSTEMRTARDADDIGVAETGSHSGRRDRERRPISVLAVQQ